MLVTSFLLWPCLFSGTFVVSFGECILLEYSESLVLRVWNNLNPKRTLSPCQPRHTMMLIVYFGSFLELQHECICCRFLVGNLVANPELALHESNWPVMLESFEILCSVHPKISMPSQFFTCWIPSSSEWPFWVFEVTFSGVKWPQFGLSKGHLEEARWPFVLYASQPTLPKRTPSRHSWSYQGKTKRLVSLNFYLFKGNVYFVPP